MAKAMHCSDMGSVHLRGQGRDRGRGDGGGSRARQGSARNHRTHPRDGRKGQTPDPRRIASQHSRCYYLPLMEGVGHPKREGAVLRRLLFVLPTMFQRAHPYTAPFVVSPSNHRNDAGQNVNLVSRANHSVPIHRPLIPRPGPSDLLHRSWTAQTLPRCSV